MNQKTIRVILIGLGLAAAALAQTASPQSTASQPASAGQAASRTSAGVVRGTIKDDTGGVIPGASIALSGEKGTVQTTTSGPSGAYAFRHVAPGTYTVTTTY